MDKGSYYRQNKGNGLNFFITFALEKFGYNVRNFVLEKFENAYMFSGSHKLAYDMTLRVALKKYNIKGEENNE